LHRLWKGRGKQPFEFGWGLLLTCLALREETQSFPLLCRKDGGRRKGNEWYRITPREACKPTTKCNNIKSFTLSLSLLSRLVPGGCNNCIYVVICGTLFARRTVLSSVHMNKSSAPTRETINTAATVAKEGKKLEYRCATHTWRERERGRGEKREGRGEKERKGPK
jgi:hypothetical protein